MAWTEHRFFKYRGCAPDPDEPRLAAGSVERDGKTVRVALDAWSGPDVDGGEEQRVRSARVAAAKEVCGGCPVLAECDAYAMVAPGLADGIRAGRTVRERGRLVAAQEAESGARAGSGSRKRKPVPADRLRTPQKLAVLRALAAFTDQYDVAIESGLDVRKANWQRSHLTTDLGLEESASRNDLLAAAVKAGLVDGSLVVPDDGSVPAIPPKTRKLLIEVEGQFLLWPSDPAEVKHVESVRRAPGRVRVAVPVRSGRSVCSEALRAKFRRVRGQEALEVAVTVPAGWADVALFPQAPVLGVAA
ncbi:WhiB family transcriptional regulator [Streptomyces sp. LUP47B]|uniref:WhiB family transcriptional regulator n=1 Tax=Streptomyces sp. LUP47B TaxID=1890286 RepID=UPI00159F2399|nr:WhiB family transcriptional regulator [Streptomyces sp. LUP47B]